MADTTIARREDSHTQGDLAAAPSPLHGHMDPPQLDTRSKAIIVAILAAVALLSFFVVAGWASSLDAHVRSITALDEKRDTVMSLVEGSTASSAAISLLPGDAGTPIAEKLVDLSSDFLIVLAAIYLEKYLLTIMGFVSFKILVPAACLLGVIAALLDVRRPIHRQFSSLAMRLALFAIAAYLVVPASVYVSGLIERTYQDSIDATLETAASTADDIEAATADASSEDDGQDSQGGILGFITQLPETVSTGVSGLTKEAQQSLNNFIEALAVMIVTSCVIPILVLLFFLWLARAILGLDVHMPAAIPGWGLRPGMARRL